ncbi:MAG: hypothetical protein H0U27_13740 [Nitrosopumilus sp.]|nr:hypothetical protein [Nitrosopumilus sp.]
MSGLDPLITSPEAFECGKMQRFTLKKKSFSENKLIIRDICNTHYLIQLTNSQFTLTGIENKNR